MQDDKPIGSQRELEILEALRLSGGSGRIQFLAAQLGVSEETIRRNIRALEEQGRVVKVHGGVHLKGISEEQPLNQRMGEQAEEKRRIAARAASLIDNGARLFLDIGSTSAFLAMALQRHSDLFVATNSLTVAHALAARNGNRIVFAGGELRSHDGGAFGAEARAMIGRLSLDHAFLSVAAIHARHGFLLHDLEEAEFNRLAASRAEMVTICADSSKFGRSAPIALDVPERFDRLVTDARPPADIATLLAANAIETILA